MLFSEDFSSYPTGTWTQGGTYGNWKLVFDGYGPTGIEVDGSNVMTQAPKAATQPAATHASLATSTAPFGDLDVSVRMRTVAQLRTGSAPNPWEVPWFIWHYTDNYHFYYVILKPNGWELGKEDPAYPGAQRFLATGGGSYAVGPWHTVRVRHVGNTITVWANGALLTTFTDNERPYASGRIGLYNEDSHVHFDDVVVRAVS